MLMGASATGARVMTSSSGPGISLKQEGISYMAGSELPGVIVNIARCGPGLGGIAPSQADYFQATRGGGHGDYKVIVLAPSSVKEMYYLTIKAFELSDKYRNPAMILADAILGQMKEVVDINPPDIKIPEKDWALNGAGGRAQRVIKSLWLDEGALEKRIWRIFTKYENLKKYDTMYEEVDAENCDILFVGFGSCARISKSAILSLKKENIRAGLFRPITLFPFPEKRLSDVSKSAKKILVVEMNTGQMLEDVLLNVERTKEVYFYGRPPGAGSTPTPEELHSIALKVFNRAHKSNIVHPLAFRKIR